MKNIFLKIMFEIFNLKFLSTSKISKFFSQKNSSSSGNIQKLFNKKIPPTVSTPLSPRSFALSLKAYFRTSSRYFHHLPHQALEGRNKNERK
jgi:hypothetical protein